MQQIYQAEEFVGMVIANLTQAIQVLIYISTCHLEGVELRSSYILQIPDFD